MKLKRWMTALLAGLAVLGLLLATAACGQTAATTTAAPTTKATEKPASDGDDGKTTAAPETEGGDTEAPETDAPETEAPGEEKEFAKIAIYNFGDPNENWRIVQDEVNAHLASLGANLEMDLRFISWSDYQNRYAIMLTGGDAWDLTYTSGTWLNLFQNIQKGAFSGFTPEEMQAALPKTYGEIGEENWKAGMYDGKIYAIPTPLYTHFVNHGFYYRGDWAIEAGIKDGVITDWQGENSMTQYMDYVKENKEGVIPWDVSNGYRATYDMWLTTYTETQALGITAAVHMFATESNSDLTVINTFELEDFENMVTLMKEWDEKGFWRADALNNTANTRDGLKAGQGAVDQHHLDTYRGLIRDMNRLQPGSDLRMYGFWVNSKNAVMPSVVHDAVSVANNSQHPMRALDFYELAMQDETLNRLLQYGIKDEHYFLNEDGELYRPDDFDPAKDGYDGAFWGWRNDRFVFPTADDDPKYLAYFDEMDQIKFNAAFDGFPFDPTNVQTQIANVDQVINTQLAALCVGKVDDVQAAVEKFRNDLKAAGADQILDEIQQQLDAYMEQRG